MTEKEFLEELKEMLEIEEDITLETHLSECDEWDSLAFISFITLVDEKFDISVTNNELTQAKTVGDLVGFVKHKLD